MVPLEQVVLRLCETECVSGGKLFRKPICSQHFTFSLLLISLLFPLFFLSATGKTPKVPFLEIKRDNTEYMNITGYNFGYRSNFHLVVPHYIAICHASIVCVCELHLDKVHQLSSC